MVLPCLFCNNGTRENVLCCYRLFWTILEYSMGHIQRLAVKLESEYGVTPAVRLVTAENVVTPQLCSK